MQYVPVTKLKLALNPRRAAAAAADDDDDDDDDDDGMRDLRVM